MSYKLIACTIYIILITLYASAHGMKSPNDFENAPSREETRAEESFLKLPLKAMLRSYQQVISPIDGDKCPMHPSCSHYSADAISKYGIFAIVMTGDRLIRCGQDLRHYELIKTKEGKLRYYDPVE